MLLRSILLPVRATSPRDLAERLVQLVIGLMLYGIALAFMVRGGIGVAPWDVLALGVAGRSGLGYGAVTVLVSIVVLLLWIPLRQRPGLGTLSNVVVIGLVLEATLALVAEPSEPAARVLFLIAGVVLNGIATGLYIGANFGPGPRDGLMTGLVGRGAGSIRLVRTGLEITVLAAGFALGGTVGIGTVLYAVSIGPLAHVFVPAFTVRAPAPAAA